MVEMRWRLVTSPHLRVFGARVCSRWPLSRYNNRNGSMSDQEVSLPPMSKKRRLVCAALYIVMIGVGIYVLTLWLGADAGASRKALKGSFLWGTLLGGLGVYLMWIDVVVPFRRSRAAAITRTAGR